MLKLKNFNHTFSPILEKCLQSEIWNNCGNECNFEMEFCDIILGKVPKLDMLEECNATCVPRCDCRPGWCRDYKTQRCTKWLPPAEKSVTDVREASSKITSRHSRIPRFWSPKESIPHTEITTPCTSDFKSTQTYDQTQTTRSTTVIISLTPSTTTSKFVTS